MLDGAKAGHFAYIGDSILGKDVNLGAGTKLANLKVIPGTVSVKVGKKLHDTGCCKLGVILGDQIETGCNFVISSGVLLGLCFIVSVGVAVLSGYYLARTIIMLAKDSLKIRCR